MIAEILDFLASAGISPAIAILFGLIAATMRFTNTFRDGNSQQLLFAAILVALVALLLQIFPSLIGEGTDSTVGLLVILIILLMMAATYYEAERRRNIPENQWG